MSGGAKLTYGFGEGKKYRAGLRYLAESKKTCWDSQCPDPLESPNLYQLFELAPLFGSAWEREKGYLSAMAGIGAVRVETIEAGPVGESRRHSQGVSLPVDLEAMLSLQIRFF